MAIVKRNAKYQVKIRAVDGSWWSCTTATREAARAVEREMLDLRAKGETWLHPRLRVVRLTVRTVAERYIIAQRANLRRRSVELYAFSLEHFTLWGEERFPRGFIVSNLTRTLLADYAQHLRTTGLKQSRSERTVTDMIGVVHRWWAWAYEHDIDFGWEGLMPRPRKMEFPRRHRPLTVAPTWAEMDSMLSKLGPSWALRIGIIQRFTAMRVGEARQLTWDDILLEQGKLIIRPEISKGGYSGRVIPLADELAELLGSWTRAGETVCGFSGGRRVPYPPWRRAWMAAEVREAAWQGRPTHALRRGVFSGVLALGADRDATELLMGHRLGGVRGSYLDPEIAAPIGEVVKLIPRLSRKLSGSASG